MFTPSIGELVIILVIILIIFGVGKLPEVGKGLGKGIKEFKKASKDRQEIDVTPTTEETTTAEKEQIEEKSSDS